MDSIGIDYSGKELIYAVRSDNKNEYSIYFMPDNISIGTFSTSTFSFKYINHQFKDQTEIVGDIELYKSIEKELNGIGYRISNRSVYAKRTKNEDELEVFVDDTLIGIFSIELGTFTDDMKIICK